MRARPAPPPGVAPMERLPAQELRFLRQAGRIAHAHGYRLFLVEGRCATCCSGILRPTWT